MDTIYHGRNYLSTLGLKLFHIGERAAGLIGTLNLTGHHKRISSFHDVWPESIVIRITVMMPLIIPFQHALMNLLLT